MVFHLFYTLVLYNTFSSNMWNQTSEGYGYLLPWSVLHVWRNMQPWHSCELLLRHCLRPSSGCACLGEGRMQSPGIEFLSWVANAVHIATSFSSWDWWSPPQECWGWLLTEGERANHKLKSKHVNGAVSSSCKRQKEVKVGEWPLCVACVSGDSSQEGWHSSKTMQASMFRGSYDMSCLLLGQCVPTLLNTKL